jgi:hypothetical protein
MRSINWGLIIAMALCAAIWSAFGLRMYAYYHG